MYSTARMRARERKEETAAEGVFQRSKGEKREEAVRICTCFRVDHQLLVSN
jgi:hypothetical protein